MPAAIRHTGKREPEFAPARISLLAGDLPRERDDAYDVGLEDYHQDDAMPMKSRSLRRTRQFRRRLD